MKRIAATALALALTAAAGSAAFAAQDYGRYDNRAAYDNRGMQYDNRYARNYSRTDVAQVVRAVPMGDPYANYQRQECWNEQVNGYQPGYYRDPNGQLYYRGTDSNANGTIIGGLIGGALGNQAGKGDGRKAATIGGAVIGGVIGNNMDRNNNSNSNNYEYRDNSGIVRRCRTVVDNDRNNQVEGYEVTYRYAGQTYTAVTRYRPGRTMRVVVNVRPQEGRGGGYGYNR